MAADSAPGPFDFPPDATVRAGSSSQPDGKGRGIGDGNAISLPPLALKRHVAQSNRCLAGLPDRFLDIDASRMALGFYCLSSLDVLGARETRISNVDREAWIDWIWEQQAPGGGFRPGPFATIDQGRSSKASRSELPPRDGSTSTSEPVPEDDTAPGHLIMTYCALLSLAVLRAEFTELNRAGLKRFVSACQGPDGGFSTLALTAYPYADADLRMLYCACVICNLLDDWTCIDTSAAVGFVRKCRTYEGGYAQGPGGEALGGTSYCAIAALDLLGKPPSGKERGQTVRWLMQMQQPDGGFSGRIGKISDACYCFWQVAALEILGAREGTLDADLLASYLASCQHVYGGIGKAPGEMADPYHTYLSLAVLSIAPPSNGDASWKLAPVDPRINGTAETVAWAQSRIPIHR
ncbi:terpenoid cyclases/Protein prenyltransferase [Peniophora sp. CONT]|nr:terpenoid cyclases/Protein prenyltransferase [Peniophora sp. CONT]